MRHQTVALIVAAGRGERAGGMVPKQFQPMAGVAVIARAIDAFGDLPVFVVIGDGQAEAFAQAIGDRAVAGTAIGGATRQRSVCNGLDAIAAAGGADKVLVHDAARPFLPARVRDALIAALEVHEGAVPVLGVADSVARASEPLPLRSSAQVVPRTTQDGPNWVGVGAVKQPLTSVFPDMPHPNPSPEGEGLLGDPVDRSGLVRVQTPQAFRFDALRDAHARWSGDPATDDAQVARAAGLSVACVAGDVLLEKITHPEDFARAEAMLAQRMISRSAAGFDVHRLESGIPLWLGGIEIAHSHGLSGHSDADVALHALTDALLGTIGAGDIGVHFPPSDARWRGAASHRFVEHARDLIAQAGGVIDFVDLTLICEAPRLAPYREAMRARIAEILRLPVTRVSLKATTTERLGFTGRGEGIAVQAIATVRLPEDL